ncbi:MAG: ribosome maturation factor RimM [Bacteroidales bacterium]|nr:ribosome maturation factor RimM [Bacteroidales bacterium]
MQKKDFYFLGKIIKTSGYMGGLVFFFDVDDIEEYKNIEAVFIDVNDELIPFAIENIRFKTRNTAIVKLEDIASEDEAVALIGSGLYMPLNFLPELTGNKFYFHEVISFSVVDQRQGNIGNIDRILDQSKLAIFVVKYKNKEILIPVSDEIIIKVDRENKTIEVDIPEGLIDIYL